jgi:hypothetical protein
VAVFFVPFRRDENTVRVHGAAASPALHHCSANQRQRRNAPGGFFMSRFGTMRTQFVYAAKQASCFSIGIIHVFLTENAETSCFFRQNRYNFIMKSLIVRGGEPWII